MRIYKFDTIKAIAMVNVILLHAYVSTIPGSALFKGIFVYGVLGASMFLFSVISGYMIRPGRWNWGKLFRLLLIAVIANFAINYVEMQSGYEPLHGYLCVATSLWYICVLIACKVLLPFFSRPAMALCVALLISWTTFLLPDSFRFNPMHRFLGFFPFFAFGYLIGNDKSASRIREWLTDDSRNMHIYQICLILATIAFIFIGITPISPYVDMIINNGGYFVNAPLRRVPLRIVSHLWFCLYVVLWIKSIPNREISITKYGKRTLAVYLLHMIPIFLCAGFIKTHPSLLPWRYAIMTFAVFVVMLFFHARVSDFFSVLISGKWQKASS